MIRIICYQLSQFEELLPHGGMLFYEYLRHKYTVGGMPVLLMSFRMFGRTVGGDLLIYEDERKIRADIRADNMYHSLGVEEERAINQFEKTVKDLAGRREAQVYWGRLEAVGMDPVLTRKAEDVGVSP